MRSGSRPVVMQLAETPVRVLGLLVTVGALVGSVLYVRRVVLVETALRRSWLLHSWLLHNWHLQQMTRMPE